MAKCQECVERRDAYAKIFVFAWFSFKATISLIIQESIC